MANISHVVFFVLSAFLLFFVLQEVTSTDCELKARINKAFKELPVVEELKQNSHRNTRNPLHAKRSTPTKSNKRPPRQSIPQLAKNIESFLQKLIPNHNLVQDLMGYITMPNPNARKAAFKAIYGPQN